MSDLWFSPLLDQAEAELIAKGVPKCYWGYISANGAPGSPSHDGLGAIYHTREHFVDRMRGTDSRMGVTVVDGRDLTTIRKWIGGDDWTDEEEEAWVQLMKDAE